MAAAQSPPTSLDVEQSEETLDPAPRSIPSQNDDVNVQLAIHDASRLEWSVTLPLPTQSSARYVIEVDLEVPAHVLAPHSPWDRFQEFARLDEPDHASPNLTTIDGLRRFAVGVAAKLSRTSEGFGRHCRLLASPFATELSEHFSALGRWLATAGDIVVSARSRLSATSSIQDEVRRETKLVDEYLSLRLLEMFGAAERALGEIEVTESYVDRMAAIEDSLAGVVARELKHRAEQTYILADPQFPQSLGRYLDRASLLKKHFQEVLFLEAERFAVSERFRHWVAGAVAVIASTWAFFGQLYLTRGSTSAQLSSSIVLVCVLAGVVYAVKDRIKEIGRNWFADNVHRFYAQRIARYRAPRKRSPTREIVISAKESFVSESTSRPDPLNPESGATVPITALRYRQHGTLGVVPALAESGIARVKHVFRYDLSPLFARLDDATKPVPVLDPKTGRISFADAPRAYRVPARLLVRYGAQVVERRGSLVIHKRGLERIEPA